MRLSQLMIDFLFWVYMHHSTAGMPVCSNVLMQNIPKHYSRLASAIDTEFGMYNNTPTLQSLIPILSCMSEDVWQTLWWSAKPSQK